MERDDPGPRGTQERGRAVVGRPVQRIGLIGVGDADDAVVAGGEGGADDPSLPVAATTTTSWSQA